MTAPERDHSQERFIYDDSRVMVATNAFGMGIDKSNVRYVIHYHMPKNMEAYYQEAGAGRDDEPAECILLFSPQDVQIQRFLIETPFLLRKEGTVNIRNCSLWLIIAIHPGAARRNTALFRQADAPENCANCSNCNNEGELIDITVDAQKYYHVPGG